MVGALVCFFIHNGVHFLTLRSDLSPLHYAPLPSTETYRVGERLYQNAKTSGLRQPFSHWTVQSDLELVISTYSMEHKQGRRRTAESRCGVRIRSLGPDGAGPARPTRDGTDGAGRTPGGGFGGLKGSTRTY